MKTVEIARLGERYFEEKLENGLTIRIIQKKDFAKKYALFAPFTQTQKPPLRTVSV